MSTPFIGEIRMFGGNFAPQGWAFCKGDLLPISDNDVLFYLIGTTYGGDGQSTFGLPNLQGRIPVHMGQLAGGSNYQLGQSGGAETVTLTTNQLPVHSHSPTCNTATGTTNNPANAVWAAQSGYLQYNAAGSEDGTLKSSIQPMGGSQPHDNMIPYQAVNYIISLFGVYPSQS